MDYQAIPPDHFVTTPAPEATVQRRRVPPAEMRGNPNTELRIIDVYESEEDDLNVIAHFNGPVRLNPQAGIPPLLVSGNMPLSANILDRQNGRILLGPPGAGGFSPRAREEIIPDEVEFHYARAVAAAGPVHVNPINGQIDPPGLIGQPWHYLRGSTAIVSDDNRRLTVRADEGWVESP